MLITTNLDNDDALSVDAVELLQKSVVCTSERHIYSFLYGYQYFADRRFLIRMRYPHNHFLTLAEPFDRTLQTIVSYTHTRAVFQLPTTYIRSGSGQWLEIVHEDNVSNDLRINIKIWNIPVLRARSLADFGLAELRVGWWGQWLKTLFLLPAQFVCTAAERLRSKRERERLKRGELS